MKDIGLKIKEWWSNLALREKRALSILGAFLAIMIVYAWIWLPLQNAVIAERKKIGTDEKTLASIQSADRAIQKIERTATAKNKSISPVVLLGILQKQISEEGLEQQLTQLKQATSDSVEMHFQKVEFDKLIVLLMDVTKQHAVTVTQLSAIAENTSGLVNVDITLRLD